MAETSTPTPVQSNENTMALVAYILTWITGLIILLTSPKEAKYQRWHAIQAIGLGVAVFAIYIVLSVILMPLVLTGSAAVFGILTLIQTLVWIGFLILWIIMMVTAYQGKKVRLPIIADMADKNA